MKRKVVKVSLDAETLDYISNQHTAAGLKIPRGHVIASMVHAHARCKCFICKPPTPQEMEDFALEKRSV